MGIKPNFTKVDIQKMFEERTRQIEQAIITNLAFLGEECIKQARENGNYIDQTGNLRSSIGYVIYVNGRPLSSDFKDYQGSKGNSGEGKKAGEALAKSVASKHKQGVVLVVVAGMNYALYVESKNRDVLSSAEHLAEKELPKMLSQLKKSIV